MQLSPKARKIIKWVAIPLGVLFTFVMAIQLTFPYDRLKGKIEEVLSAKFDAEVTGIERSLVPGRFRIERLMLWTRPSTADEKKQTIILSDIEVDIGLLSLLSGKLSVDVDAQMAGGKISLGLGISKAALDLSLVTKGLPVHQVPAISAAVGLPMEGGLNASVSLHLPKNNWAEADGRIKVSCPACTIGDGVTKIKPRAPGNNRRAVFASEGVTVPKLEIGGITGDIEIKKGRGVIRNFGGKSKDGEIRIEAELMLAKVIGDSTMPGCMKFKLSPELQEREPNFGNLPMVIGVALDDQGFANLRMVGKLSALKWLPARSCGGEGNEADGPPSIDINAPPPVVNTGNPTMPDPSGAMPTPEPAMPDPPRELDGPGNSGPIITDNDGTRPPDDVQPGNQPPEPPPSPEPPPPDDSASVPNPGARGMRGEQNDPTTGEESQDHVDNPNPDGTVNEEGRYVD